MARDSCGNTEDFVLEGGKKEDKKETHFPCKFSGTKIFCALEGSGSRCINRAETRVIKGYAASAHHILAAKLEQMCCLWDPMGMIKDYQWRVMSERLFSFLLFVSLCNSSPDRKNLFVQTHLN